LVKKAVTVHELVGYEVEPLFLGRSRAASDDLNEDPFLVLVVMMAVLAPKNSFAFRDMPAERVSPSA
jgi:hypothetical protein